ncbi:MAG: hypothetical protein M3O29_04895, partial [Actinomycetota bacterium]|nr:hypothetical protein [Actinomycetota bacterium]
MLRGVAQQVLDDALEHPGVGAHGDRGDLDGQLPLGDELGVRHDLADQRADVDPRVVRLRDAAREPLEVEEVAHHAIEPARVLRDPAGEVARVGGVDRQILPFEGDREPQDCRERGPQIVRDRVQEGRLHLVLGAEPLGLEPL